MSRLLSDKNAGAFRESRSVSDQLDRAEFIYRRSGSASSILGTMAFPSKEPAWHGRCALRMVLGFVGRVPPARRRHGESALTGFGRPPQGTSAHIARTECGSVIIIGQRRTARTRALTVRKHPRRRAVRGTQQTGVRGQAYWPPGPEN